MPVLIDTSAWVEALRRKGDPVIRQAVHEAIVSGAARSCEMVLLELWNGARGRAESSVLRQIEQEVELLPITVRVWQAANDTARRCRGAGITVPATDLLIAACARHNGAGLLHRDPHFDRIAAMLDATRDA